MDVSKEEENFFRVTRLVFREIPTQIRKFFKEKWDIKFAKHPWDGTADGSGDFLWNRIKNVIKNMRPDQIEKIQSGDCNSWDMTIICAVILNAGLCLIQKKRPERQQQAPLLESENIQRLLDVRNTRMNHLPDCSIPLVETENIFKVVRDIYTDFNWPQDELDKIENETFTTEEVKRLRKQFEKERKEAIAKDHEDFHNLPVNIENYVGREEEMENLLKAVNNRETSANIILIHGGPCYGKSAFATRFGYEMRRKGYNYVIWIDIREVYPLNDSIDALREDKLAIRILDEFGIACTDNADQAEKYLKSKFRKIEENGKHALIILDNADSLIECQKPGNTSTKGAYSMIRSIAKSSAKFVLTSRSCKLMDVTKVEIKKLTDEESKMYIEASLNKETLMDRSTLVDCINECSNGMPLALKILTYAVNSTEDRDCLEDYLNDVKQEPVKTIDEEHPITHLFEISFEHLKHEELQLMRILAVFPGAFSYTGAEKMSKYFGSKARIIQAIRQKGLLERYDDKYHFHPLLLDYIRRTKWNGDDIDKYEAGFIQVYVESLFQLGLQSLEKDQYSECLSEFKKEKSNFLYLMDLLRQSRVVNKEWSMFNRDSEEYIAVMLFARGLVYAPTLIDFFTSCETLASQEYKYRPWSCQFELNKKVFDSLLEKNDGFNDDDDYCCLLLERRRLNEEVHPRAKSNSAGINTLIDDLKNFLTRAQQLRNKKLASYFQHKACKLLGHAYKRTEESRSEAIDFYTKALQICESSHGKHLDTVDCYIQLAKFYWKFKEFENANEYFEKADELAKAIQISGIKMHSSYLLGHGRCLIDSEIPENVEKGVTLLEKSLKLCDDTEIKFVSRALEYLVRVDKCHSDKVISYLFKLKNPDRRILKLVTTCFINDAEQLMEASRFVADIYEKKQNWCRESYDQLKSLLIWNSIIKKCSNDGMIAVAPPEVKLVDFAEKALECYSGMEERVSILKWLCEVNPKYYDLVLPELKRQEQQDDKLLKLVTHKFLFESGAPVRELDEKIIQEIAVRGTKHLQECIDYIQGVCDQNRGDDNQQLIQSLFIWNKLIATRTAHVYLESGERAKHAEEALRWKDLGATGREDEVKKLEKVVRDNRVAFYGSEELQKLEARENLLGMMSKNMIDRGMKDDLEARFKKLLEDSRDFIDIRVRIIKYVLGKLKITVERYQWYLKELFEIIKSKNDGICEWHCRIFVDNLPLLLSSSEFGGNSIHPGVKICKEVLNMLISTRRKMFGNYKRDRLRFEIRYILAVNTEGKLDDQERKRHARSAIELFQLRNKDADMTEKFNELRHFVDAL